MIQTHEVNLGAEGVVKVVRYCDYLAEIRRIHKEYEQEIREAARDAASEAIWKNSQGEDYGTY